METSGEVQVYVNGKPQSLPCNLIAGDSLLFTMPGNLICGKLAISENENKQLKSKLEAWGLRVASYEESLRKIAEASSLDEAIGIAYRSGALAADG